MQPEVVQARGNRSALDQAILNAIETLLVPSARALTAPSVIVELRLPGAKPTIVRFSPWEMLTSLGKKLSRQPVEKGYARVNLNCPTAREAHDALMESRQVALGDTDGMFSRKLAGNFTRHRKRAGLLISTNALLVFFAHRYDLPEKNDLGWFEGLLHEMALMADVLPPVLWSPAGRDFIRWCLRSWKPELTEESLLASPSCSAEAPCERRESAPREVSLRSKWVRGRLRFYLGTPGYTSFHPFRNSNNRYAAVIFSTRNPTRIVMALDTELRDNAVYLFAGTRSECLAAAVLPKAELQRQIGEGIGVCQRRINHTETSNERVRAAICELRES